LYVTRGSEANTLVGAEEVAQRRRGEASVALFLLLGHHTSTECVSVDRREKRGRWD
jgi:hypothetical protein